MKHRAVSDERTNPAARTSGLRLTSFLLLLVAAAPARPMARSAILMIPDGCSFSIATLSRWYSGRALALDPLLCGAVRTDATNSVITESAAAATAFATGHKTSVGFIGLTPGPERRLHPDFAVPDSLQFRPVATLLEAAKLAGKSIGLVATSAIAHATPAGFAAHVPDREQYDEIMKQLAYQSIDVVLGGGQGWLRPGSQGGRRGDDLDLARVLARRGCRLVRNAAELAAVRATPVWGLFAEEHLRPEADRSRQGPAEPSLPEMTARAIELLSADTAGFFLMVEGSQVDWADHANDPFYAVTEFLAFDSAVRIAQDFAARDGRTLLIACPDHNCGGLSIGSATSPVQYDFTSLGDLLAPLHSMKLTSTGLLCELGPDRSAGSIRRQVQQWWGIALADGELADIRALHDGGMDLDHAISEVVSRNHTVFGWTSHGHTGEDVPLWTWGPGRPSGLLDNSQIAPAVAAALELDLAAATRELFADLGRPSGTTGLRLDQADRDNPALTAGDIRLLLGTDLLVRGADTTILGGITVSSLNGHVYGPAAALAATQVALRVRTTETGPEPPESGGPGH